MGELVRVKSEGEGLRKGIDLQAKGAPYDRVLLWLPPTHGFSQETEMSISRQPR